MNLEMNGDAGKRQVGMEIYENAPENPKKKKRL